MTVTFKVNPPKGMSFPENQLESDVQIVEEYIKKAVFCHHFEVVDENEGLYITHAKNIKAKCVIKNVID